MNRRDFNGTSDDLVSVGRAVVEALTQLNSSLSRTILIADVVDLQASLDAKADASSVREMLTADRTYYVRTDGTDTNSGLINSAAGAFLTMQKAFDVIANTLDCAGFSPTIQLGNTGTFTSGIVAAQPLVGAGTLYVRGDVATPANTLLSVTNAHGLLSVQAGLSIDFGGIEFRTTTSGNCVWAFRGASMIMSTPCRFGAAAGDHLLASEGGLIEIYTPYTISGNMVNHWHAYGFGEIVCQNQTITLTGTPAISGNFAGNAQGAQYILGNTFSGAATGKRYLSHKNGVIDTNGGGATYLPGNVAGTTATGGQYI